MAVLDANRNDVRGSTYVLKRLAYGQRIIWRLHHFLNQFGTRRHDYPSSESGNLE